MVQQMANKAQHPKMQIASYRRNPDLSFTYTATEGNITRKIDRVEIFKDFCLILN